MSHLLVLTNLPDRAAAERIADLLIARQLAACVNILAPCRSVYRWKDEVQRDEEHPMLIKTTQERYPALDPHAMPSAFSARPSSRRSPMRSQSATARDARSTSASPSPRR